MNKVDESIADVAAVGEIDGQVQEVELVFVILVDLLFQHLLCVLVRDVPNHKCCSTVMLDLHRKISTFEEIILYYDVSLLLFFLLRG